MQNRTAIWVFTILLALACLYQLSFTWVANSVESNADQLAQERVDSMNVADGGTMTQLEMDTMQRRIANNILSRKGEQDVYPLLGWTYDYVKKREINLGLDLQGGMNATVAISKSDLLINLAGENSEDPVFEEALAKAREMEITSGGDFIDNFGDAYAELAPETDLWTIFNNFDNQDFVEPDTPNEEVIKKLRETADDAVVQAREVIGRRIDNLGVVQPKIQLVDGGRIMIELPGIRDKRRVEGLLRQAQLEFWEMHENQEVGPRLEEVAQMLLTEEKDAEGGEEAAEEEPAAEPVATPEPVEPDTTVAANPADSTSKDSTDLALADDSLASDTTPVVDESEVSPLYRVFQPNVRQDANNRLVWSDGPVIGFVREENLPEWNAIMARDDVQELLGEDVGIRRSNKAERNENNGIKFYQIFAIDFGRDGSRSAAKLTGDQVSTARATTDEFDRPEVNLIMNGEGASIWAKMTEDNVGKYIGVLLDDLVYTAPRINEKIATGNSSISGSFTTQEASDLASVLKAGRLRTRSIMEQSTLIGPSLGDDARRAGLLSFLLALVVILVYMIFYYNRAGIVADIALVVNMFFIMGVLASLGATLTLPGIAGIVLTIGMSVDANVLIYERIREELREGKGLRLAIVDGYKAAYSSIIDANITTLLTGIILSIFGSGPIQGFATTLIIGIMTSLFSAIFITRLVFEWRLDSKKEITFATRMTESAFKNVNFAFVAKRKTYYIVSGVIIAAGLLSLGVRGLDWGTDFTGGRTYTVRFDQPADLDAIKASLDGALVTDNDVADNEVKISGSSHEVRITTNYLNNVQNANEQVDQAVYDAIKGQFASEIDYEAYLSQDEGKEFGMLASTTVSPAIAEGFRTGALWSVLFSLLVIFLYIVMRFNKWQFGAGALVAMLHDVLVVLAMFSILYNFLPFAMEIDQAFIAAILTVVGYSINDTVVVFDRIREHLGLYKRKEMSEVVNGALNSTLSRTFNTSISTFFVLLMIFIFGGEAIRGFVFALMIGVVVGTYSSLCVATPIVLDFNKNKPAVATKKK